MDKKNKKIILAISGASGALYAYLLIKKLSQLIDQISKIDVVISEKAKKIWEYELSIQFELPEEFNIYDNNDFNAPFASGSNKYDVMIICPCSMGLIGRIASGNADTLISRAADVMLKERRKLILVPRETPLNLIHINNMKTLTEAGAIICFASPSFYHKPKSMEELCMTIINRIIDLCELTNDDIAYKWQK